MNICFSPFIGFFLSKPFWSFTMLHMLFELKDVLVKQELDDYMYEETKYMTTTIETIHMENICIKELKEALEKGDEKWLTENHFIKTLKNVTK